MSGHATAPPPISRRQTALLLGIVLGVLCIALPIITYPLGRDQGEFAVLGRGLLWGRTPYIDLWNPKPPAVFYVYALFIGLFGRTTEAIRLIDFALYPLLALLVFDIGRRLMSVAVGLWAALLLGVFYFGETFWTLTQNDGIAMLPMALSAWLALLAVTTVPAVTGQEAQRRALLLIFSGVSAGVAIWFKYPFALFAAAVGLWAIARLWPQRRQAVWAVLVFGAGAAAVLVGGVLYLAALGALDAWLESVRVTSAYTTLGFEPRTLLETMAASLQFRWLHWGILVVLALPGLFVFRRRALPLLWLAASVGALLVQAKGYDYHYLPMLPPLALFGAAGVGWWAARLHQAVRRTAWAHVAQGLLTAGLLLALAGAIWPRAWDYLAGREDRAAYDARFIAGEFNAGESRRTADYLRERVAVGDSLTIWGFRPEIYYLADLNPATRFMFQFPLVGAWYPAEWRQEHVAVLWAAMPPYALVLQADWMPWVTGIDADSNTLLQAYPALNDWLIENYTFETQLDNVLIWKRKAG